MKRIACALLLAAFGTCSAGWTALGQTAEAATRVFPEWKSDGADGESGLLPELRKLVRMGRRDRAASPEFLDALEALACKYGGMRTGVAPSGRLPWRAVFAEEGWPAGWKATNRSVWEFGDGEARQVRSWANARFVLFYEPGLEWTDYSVTFRCESDEWLQPPGRSAAVLYFRFHNVEENYSFWLDGAGDITLISNEKGKDHRILARVSIAPEVIRDTKPWTVKIHGNTIEVWHRGKRLLLATDSVHPSGSVGLESVHIPMKFWHMDVRPWPDGPVR